MVYWDYYSVSKVASLVLLSRSDEDSQKSTKLSSIPIATQRRSGSTLLRVSCPGWRAECGTSHVHFWRPRYVV